MKTHSYKNIEFWEWGPPATQEQIADVEHTLGGKFPDEYRDLLSNINGGRVYNDMDFKLAIYDDSPRIWSVAIFNSVGADMPSNILSEMAGLDFVERVPDLIVPICTLTADYRICISLRNKDKGHIYMWAPMHLWATEDDGPNQKDEKDLIFLATSFSEFLAMLKPQTE